MNASKLRRERCCMPGSLSAAPVSLSTAIASAFIAGAALSTTTAHASQHHVLLHGESLASLGRKYHVSVEDIAKANDIRNVNSVPDGFNLTIPPRPKHLDVSPNIHRIAIARADRVGVRLGPGPEYRKVDACDQGAVIVVTAERDGWAQVKLESGRVGWIRHDFIKYKGAETKNSEHVAAAPHHKHSDGVAKEAHRKHSEHIAKADRHKHSHHEETVAERHHHKHSSGVANRSRHGVRLYAEADRPRAGNEIVRTAYSYRGTPYVYGAAGRGGFDCSGFTSFVYKRHGVSLPHSARGQFETGKHVSKSELKAGDLVFFHTVTSGISHVGMYVGNGKFVHASSRRSGGVRVDSLDSGYYSSAYRGARRVK